MSAHAWIKTDVIDAAVLARLFASNFLPEVWLPDPKTLARRRQVTRRKQILSQRVRLKTTAQSILRAHLLLQQDFATAPRGGNNCSRETEKSACRSIFTARD